jgi:hypothetical protein
VVTKGSDFFPITAKQTQEPASKQFFSTSHTTRAQKAGTVINDAKSTMQQELLEKVEEHLYLLHCWREFN